MTDAASAGPPPTAEAQDPLPEANWLWRRVFSFGVALALLIGAQLAVSTIGAVAANGSETAIRGLVAVTKTSLYLLAFVILLYLLAPSAEQLTKLVQTGSALRQGVSFRSSVTATSPDGATATAMNVTKADAIPPAEPELSLAGFEQAELPDKTTEALPWEKDAPR